MNNQQLICYLAGNAARATTPLVVHHEPRERGAFLKQTAKVWEVTGVYKFKDEFEELQTARSWFRAKYKLQRAS